MITNEKLNIYQRFNGDIHTWGEFGSAMEKSEINDDEWLSIDELIQDLSLIKTGLASDTFIESVDRKLNDCCADENTINEMKRIA